LPLLQGRDFNEADYDAPNVLIVSKSFANRHWPHESAIGKSVRFDPPKKQKPWRTVIGMVADSKMRGLQQAEPAAVYLPYSRDLPRAGLGRSPPAHSGPAQAHHRRSQLHLSQSPADPRADSGADVLAPALLFRVDDLLKGIALMLATVGFYAMLSYSVSLQRQEIAVRIALGASYSSVLGLVVSEGLRLVGIGLATGAVLAASLTPLLQSQIFEVSPMGPAAWIFAVLVIIVVAGLAMFGPLRKAIHVDTVVALREP
jgi:hypothetical protein